MWWPGVGWPDVRGLNEANRSREQQLWIRELFREEISPSCPSISSGKEPVYRIFVHCFGEAQLGETTEKLRRSDAQPLRVLSRVLCLSLALMRVLALLKDILVTRVR